MKQTGQTNMLPQRLRTLYCSALLLAASGAASHAGVRQGWGVGMVVTGNRELVLETGRESRAISLAASIWTGGDSRANESDCGDIHRASAWPAVVYSCAAQMRGGASAQAPGPNDYSATLKDQSKPWWMEDKKTHMIVPAKKGGGLFGTSGSNGGAGRSNKSGGNGNNGATRSRSSSGVGNDVSDTLTVNGGLLALAALPAIALLKNAAGAEKGGETRGSFFRSTPKRISPPVSPRPAVAVKAKPPASRKPDKAERPAAVPKPSPTKATPSSSRTAAGSTSAAVRPGSTAQGGLESFCPRLVPEQPAMRAVGILALAALGSGGLYKLNGSGLLKSAWPISFVDPWQVLTALAYTLNMQATFLGGRLDGRSGDKSERSPLPIRFFAPAWWAFAIWGPIFLGEMSFVLFQLLPLPSVRGSWWLADISPWFAAAMLFQSLWCLSFRPWARDAGLLWLPALMLGAVAVALGGVHAILREAWFARDMELPQYLAIHLPLSLHFGWISCAALVNLNGYVASRPSQSNRVGLVVSVCSVIVAVVLGALVTLTREDPVYSAVIAWALWAVGSKAGWASLEGRVDAGALRVQQVAAKTGSMLALVTAGIPLGLALKDVVMGGADDVYDEEY